MSQKMWLSAALLLTMVSTVDSSLSLYIGHCGPPSTGRIQQLAYNTYHEQRTGCHRTVETTCQVLTNGDF